MKQNNTPETITEEVFVDAGCIWIGDPCYIMGDAATNRVHDWSEFCDKMDDQFGQDGISKPLGDGVGCLVSSGYGDGSYPVKIEKKDGMVRKVTITFFD